MKIEISSLLAFGCLLCAGPSSVAAQEFYAGKTITIVVGAAAGGGFDTYARLFARHMPKHIPGRPPPSGKICRAPESWSLRNTPYAGKSCVKKPKRRSLRSASLMATITNNIATLYQLKPGLVGELKMILWDQSKR